MTSETKSWPDGRRCALSLTYDDALPVHRTLVAETLEINGLRATFYVPFRSGDDLREQVDDWRALAERGHELGNHTLFHPCRRAEGRNWPAPWYDLKTYSLERLRDELEVANFALELIDGRKERSFGNTCCNTQVGPDGEEVCMNELLAELFPAARGSFSSKVCKPFDADFNPMDVGLYGIDDRSFEEVRPWIEEAIAVGGWIVFMAHGIGEGTHPLYMDPDEHQQLIRWIAQENERIWCAPFIDVAKHVLA